MREGFKDALVQEFNERFGTDGNDLAAWQNLCNVLRIVPVPDTIRECRQVSMVILASHRITELRHAACLGYACQPCRPR